MKRFVFGLILGTSILAASSLGSSQTLAGTQAGPSSPATSATTAVENNSAKPEKQDTADSRPSKKTKKHDQQDGKRADSSSSRSLTPEEQEWEKAVYNP